MQRNNIAVKLKAILIHGHVADLKQLYATYGDELINELMIKKNGYYQLRLHAHLNCIDYIHDKAKKTPALLKLTDEMLITSIHDGSKPAIRIAKEENKLNHLLFHVVDYIRHDTAVLLSYCKQQGADLCMKTLEGDTLLHALSQAHVRELHSRQPGMDEFHVNSYEGAIAYLVSCGLSLQTKNKAGQTPEDLALNNNVCFMKGVKQYREEQAQEAADNKNCNIM